jgi:hypothetical protein
MARISLSFVELHNPLFMQGTNLTNKIVASQRQAKLEYDLDKKLLIVRFKGKAAILPDSNVASMDVINAADLGLEESEPVSAPTPAIARRRGRPSAEDLEAQESAYMTSDSHREAVRAQSANAFKPAPVVDTQANKLMEQARAVAAGAKVSPQVSEPTKPANGLTGVSGKPKAISHEQLAAQVKAEKSTE